MQIVVQCANLPSMDTTLTIRLSKANRAALKRRAAAEKRSESALVREIIDREINRGFDFEKVRHLAGSVTLDRKKMRGDGWAEHLRENNWRK